MKADKSSAQRVRARGTDATAAPETTTKPKRTSRPSGQSGQVAERKTHARAYGEGKSTTHASKAGGAAAAMLVASTLGQRASDAAKEALKATLTEAGKTGGPTMQLDVTMTGAGAARAADSFAKKVAGAFAGSKTAAAASHVAKLSGPEVVAYIGIAATIIQAATALVKVANELLPEVTEMARKVKDLFRTIRHKDTTVTVGDETMSVKDLVEKPDAELARLLAPAPANQPS